MPAQAGAELAPERLRIRAKEDANSGQPGLLCGKRQRARNRRAGDERDELAPLHVHPYVRQGTVRLKLARSMADVRCWQFRNFGLATGMSGLPSGAVVVRPSPQVRKVPGADSRT